MAWHASVRRIPSGNPGNLETLRAMSALARRGSTSPVVVEAAQNAVRGTPERDDEIDFEAVLRDVRRRMRYTHDPLEAEVVKDPAFVIQRTNDPESTPEPMDCDDASVLCASMLGALGYATRFATVAVDPKRPKEWSHVYVLARRNNGRWVALDPIVRKFGVGDEVPRAQVLDRAYHEGVAPMPRLGCYGPRCSRLAGFGEEAPFDAPVNRPIEEAPNSTGLFRSPSYWELPSSTGSFSTGTGTSWWERLLDSGSTAASRIIAARRRGGNRQPLILNAGQTPPQSPGFFSNPDGTTNWLKVGLVGAAAVGGAILIGKMAKGR